MTTINNLTKHELSGNSGGFKVGDLVVSKENNKLVCEVIKVNGGLGRLKSEQFDHVYPLCDFRHATPPEIKAGHRLEAERHG